ncbi:MAG TPA: hypothetical protein VMU80_09990 [Bryobacteraceae bacterium]|nr:hypothetical protein [Bryobacteraceae bacterium]
MKWSLALVCCAVLTAAGMPRLSFTKSFPGSTPPYIGITVDKNGAGEYKEAENDDNPVHFQMAATDVSQMFDLAAKLGYFDHPLASPLKVAFMGDKTFRYEDGTRKNEVKFNFSEDLSAQALTDWFERISESEQLLTIVQVAAKYDHLGVDKALLQLQAAYERKRLVAIEQYLPLLDRIAKNEMYLHQDCLRAAALAEAFRAAK